MSSQSRHHDHRIARAIVLLLVLAMLSLVLTPLAHAAGTFTDDDGNVHEGMIEAIAAANVTKGCNPSGTLYCPADFVTRGQMASFLARAFDLPVSPVDFFPDDNGTTHEDNINRIAFAGVTLGFPDGTYKANLNVRRDQMASFIARATAGLPPPVKDYFSDDNGNVHEENINTLAENAISLGCNPQGTLYCPGEHVRRDQMASFLGRALGLDPIDPGTKTTTTITTTITSSTTTTTMPEGHKIRVSTSSDRSSPTLLDGQTVSGDIYVFVNDETDITKVDFFVNDPAMNGGPFQSELAAPFDLAGTAGSGDANPLDTTPLAIGSNNITALVMLTGGGSEALSANFTVNNPPALYFNPATASVTVAETGVNFEQVMLGVNDGSTPTFVISEDASWLTVNPTGGTVPVTITVTADSTGLSPGMRTATVSATAAGKGAAELAVVFNVQNDGLCSPLTCADVLIAPDYILDFASDHGEIGDVDSEGSGFTWVMRATNGAGYIRENVDLDTIAQVLSITTTSGIAFEGVNSQDNALGVGLNFSLDPVLEISTTIVNPPAGTGAFQQAGIWFGNYEDDYVKLAVVSDPGGTFIQLLEENSGATNESTSAAVGNVSSSTIVLTLVANPTASTVSGSYVIDGGLDVPLGTVTVPPGFFASAPPPIGTDSFGGIFATHRNGPGPLTYTFDEFSVVQQP